MQDIHIKVLPYGKVVRDFIPIILGELREKQTLIYNCGALAMTLISVISELKNISKRTVWDEHNEGL